MVICRFKGDFKIMFKCFKEIFVKFLEMFFFSGRIGMIVRDKFLLVGFIVVGVFIIVGEVILFLVYSKLYFMNFVFFIVLILLFIGIVVLFNYISKSKKYLEDLYRILYFKIVVNNRGFLVLMVDRA